MSGRVITEVRRPTENNPYSHTDAYWAGACHGLSLIVTPRQPSKLILPGTKNRAIHGQSLTDYSSPLQEAIRRSECN
jgi:hypothetical protein